LDSQIIASVIVGGNKVAALECCSSDHKIDHFNNDTTTSRDLAIVGAPTVQASQHGTLHLGIQPVGNDTWDVIPTLILKFSDGSTIQKGFQQAITACTHSNHGEIVANW